MKRTLIIATTAAALWCAHAPADAQSINIRPIEIAGFGNAINPMVCDSVLYFASNRKSNVAVTYTDHDGQLLYRLYRIPLHHKRPRGRARLLLEHGNTPANQIALGIDPQSKELLVTQNKPAAGRGEEPSGYSIYRYGDTRTAQAENLALQTIGSNAAYAAFSPDGRTLYFASDMAGGAGSTDLYYCDLKNGQWTKPRSMGSNINTDKAEIAPFVHPSGKIFFSSNGRSDSRRLDIYYTYREGDTFAEPRRFDPIVNSVGDDYGIFFSDNEEWGYITSNRYGTEQLFFFKQEFPRFPEAEEMQTENYCFTFFEETAANYDTTQFQFRWRFSDGAELMGLEVDHCLPGAGQYIVTLDVLDKVSNEDLYTIADYPISIEKPRQVNITTNARATAGTDIIFSANGDNITDFTPSDYYWDFGAGNKFKGKSVSFRFEKAGTYKVKCGTIAVEDPTIRLCTWVEIEVTEN